MIWACVKFAVPLVVGVGVKVYCDWRKKQELYKLRSDLVNVVNNGGDMDDIDEVSTITKQTKKLKSRLRYNGMPAIIKAIQFAEMKVGLLKRSEANKMVVDKLIRDFMVRPVADGGLGMRNHAASKDYTVAVAMYFLPRHQATICNKIGELKVDEEAEAKCYLGLDGSY